MKPEIISVIVLTVIAVFLLFSVIGTIYYEIKSRRQRLQEVDKSDWLFKNIHETIFNLFYKNKDSGNLCGLDREEYIRKCKVIHKKPEYKTVVAMRIEGAVISLIFLFLAYVTTYNTVIMALCLLVALASYYFFWIMPNTQLKSKVEDKLFYVKDDLPRFLALLEKAMDLPIDQAMLITASRFESPLSDDIIDSINKVSLGANGWQETLLELAKIYEIEDFSDLVLEIVNSYEQGVNIRHLVERKAYEVEQSRLYAVESHDSKIKTMIYLPIIGFKVLPLMVLICLPMLGDLI